MLTGSLIKDIAVIGGAGPEAGIILCKQVVHICQTKYLCKRDHDFPYIALLSFPFTEMLKVENKEKVAFELDQIIQNECKNAKIWTIACNTLHCYLENLPLPNEFVNMMEETAKVISPRKKTIVFCSTTSKLNQVHRHYFECDYPAEFLQVAIDELIDDLIANSPNELVYKKFIELIKPFQNEQIVLGCTEFSILNDYFKLPLNIIDPLRITAEKICSLHFEKKCI